MRCPRSFLLASLVAGSLAGFTGTASADNIFNFTDITNGGANRFWVTDQFEFKVAGADVSGRETYICVNDWLDRAADLYDGYTVSFGNANQSSYPAGQVVVQGNAIVKLSGSGVDGSYRFQFSSVNEADNFADYFRQVATDGNGLLQQTQTC